jgi:predicted ATPase/DNA-binding CsgD family transcriptional regulator
VGKTRLGLQVAADLHADFANGAAFVSLAPINDAGLVAATLARALGLRDESTQPPRPLLKLYLQARRMLLLLDNFEQVIAAAPLVAELLATSPGLKIVCTSREVLHVRGEHEYAVPPLALPDLQRLPEVGALAQYAAVALFVRCAQAVKPDFALTGATGPVVAEICARLDGLPLAIELAAARIKVLPPSGLLARLEQRLDLLVGGPRDLPARQRTLRDTIAWSYDLLSTAEQRTFRRLAVCMGGCTLEAADALASEASTDPMLDAPFSILNSIEALVDKSLLLQVEQADGTPRLALLETVRAYGLELLDAEGEAETARARHAAFFLRLAEQAEPQLRGPQPGVALEYLALEQDNLRAALQWALSQENSEMALRLCGALWRFWRVRGDLSEGRRWLDSALARHARTPAAAHALTGAGVLARDQGDYRRARELLEEARAIYHSLQNQHGLAEALADLGLVAHYQGEHGQARLYSEESLALYRQLGDQQSIADALLGLGNITAALGNPTEAAALFSQSMKLARQLGDNATIAWVLTGLGNAALYQGDAARARALFEESLGLFRSLGHKRGSAWALINLGIAVQALGQEEHAAALFAESLALLRALGDQRGSAWALNQLAYSAYAQNEYPLAAARFAESLALRRAIGDQHGVAECLDGLACLAVAHGLPEAAAQLWGAAAALRNAAHAWREASRAAVIEQAQAAARARLGAVAFAAASTAGRARTIEQLLAPLDSIVQARAHPADAIPAPPEATAGALLYPAGLTEREVVVLRLVAAGLTNAQVAAQLVISPRSVSAHLRSIYGKLDVSSRSAATRYAIEHKLV